MAKLINVYAGMHLSPEQEREMFVQSFQYILDKIDPFIQSKYFDKLYEIDEEMMGNVESGVERLNQMCDYIKDGFWD